MVLLCDNRRKEQVGMMGIDFYSDERSIPIELLNFGGMKDDRSWLRDKTR